MKEYQEVVNQAQGVAATPYQAYGGELVAPVNEQQYSGINAVNNASGIQDPSNFASGALDYSASGAINPDTVSASDIQQYESPYNQDVVNATEAEFQNQNQQQAASLASNSISSGAFGGDRAGVAQAALAGQQQLSEDPTIAGLYNQNYAQALGEANVQQQAGMTAEEQTAQNRLQAASQFAGLGSTMQGEALNEANAQVNAGTLEQTTQQAQNTAAYNQFLQQQAYPFQTTGWLANIIEGIGSQSGGTSTGQTTTTGSAASGILGGLGVLSAFMKRGGRIPHRAAGGGLAPSPYQTMFDPTTGQPMGLGGGTIVPTINLPVGHTMPGQTGQPQGQTNNQAQPSAASQLSQGLQTGQNLANSKIGQQISSGLGSLFAPQPTQLPGALGATPTAIGGNDTLASGMGDLSGLYARGGLVARKRPHYDDGGGVPTVQWNPDPNGTGLSPESLVQSTTPIDVAAQLRGGTVTNPNFQPNFPVAQGGIPTAPVGSPANAGLSPQAATVPGALATQAQLYTPSSSMANGLASPNNYIPPLAASPPYVGPAGTVAQGSAGGPLGIIPGDVQHITNTPVAGGAPITKATGQPGEGGGILPAASGADPNSFNWDQYPNTPAGHAAAFHDYSLARAATAKNPFYDPQLTQDIPATEGNNATGWKTPNLASQTDIDPKTGKPFSFFDYQLNFKDGLGVGSGIDPNDPNAWKQAGKLAIDYQADHGYGPWKGDQAVAAYQKAKGFDPTATVSPSNAPAASPKGINPDAPAPGVAPAQEEAPQKSGLLGLNLPPDMRMGLLAAGLGAMAGTSRSALVNIGQGGLAGVNAYQQNRTIGANVGLTQAQTQQVQTEADIKKQQLNLMLQAAKFLPGGSQYGQNAPGSPAATAAATTPPASPVPGAGGGPGPKTNPYAPAPAGPAGPSAVQPTVDPDWDPPTLMKRAQLYALGGLPEVGRIFESQANQINTTGRVHMLDGSKEGSWGFLPGFQQSEANLAGAKAGAEEQAKSGFEMVPYQPDPNGPIYQIPKAQALAMGAAGPQGQTAPAAVGAPPPSGAGPAGATSTVGAGAGASPGTIKEWPSYYGESGKNLATWETEQGTAFDARQIARQRLDAIQGLMQKFQPGAWSEQKADILRYANSVGIPVNTDYASSYQQFVKYATQNVFDNIKGMGGRVLVSEIMGLTKANANPELTPAAAAAIVAQGQGVLNYADQKFSDYNTMRNDPNNKYKMINPNQFDVEWTKQHNIDDYVEAASKRFGYAGQDIPAAPQRTVGQVYMLPRGPREWRGTGWARVQAPE